PKIGVVAPEDRQDSVPGVRGAVADLLSARVVPGPNSPGIAVEPLRRREVQERFVLPETAQAPEGRDTRLGRDAGAGERGDAPSARQQVPQTRRDDGHPFSPRADPSG